MNYLCRIGGTLAILLVTTGLGMLLSMTGFTPIFTRTFTRCEHSTFHAL